MAKKADPIKSYKKLRGVAKQPTGMAAIKFYLSLPFLKVGQVFRDWFAGRLPRWAAWSMEIGAVLIVCLIFIYINNKLQLHNNLGGLAPLRKVWLGLIVLLVWGTGRLTLALVRQFPRQLSRFPDIRLAVQAGEEFALDNGIDLQEVPVFLVIGATDDCEAALVKSPFVGQTVKIHPAEFPLHWYGDSEALWVTLPGVSAISIQTQRWQASDEAGAQRNGYRLTHAEKEQAYRRMTYAMRLIRQIRKGTVSVNGVVLLIPIHWMLDPDFAKLHDTIKIDMVAAQTELDVKCSCMVMFHGIERLEEFRAYMDRFPEAIRQRRCGCTLPEFAQHEPQDNGALHRWLFRFFRQQIYGFYVADLGNARNGALYRFLHLIEQAREGFNRVMSNALAQEIRDRFYLGGVYFVELCGEQRTFFDGVVAKLRNDHDEVIGWTDRALRRNARLSRVVTLVTALVIGVLVLDTVLICSRIFSGT